MKITNDSNEYSKLFYISPIERYHSIITVCKRKSFGTDTWEKADINWSAIGSTDIETAKLFAEGLQVAIGIMNDLDKEVKN